MEVWLDIPGYEGRYQVSDAGRVRSARCVLKPGIGSRGYELVSLYPKRTRNVHVMVAEAFLENPNALPQVNHKDTNKRNNAASNLEWCTNAENHAHAATHGLKARGEANGNSKLTAAQVLRIKERIAQEITDTQLSAEFKVNRALIAGIRKGTHWGWLHG